MAEEMPRRKMIRLPNFTYSGKSWVYFLTLCTRDKQPYFSDNAAADIIEEEIRYRCASGEARVFCFCIMPDHVHMLITLSDIYPRNLQTWVSAFKRYSSKKFKEKLNIRDLWQKNFYEHVVRKDESLVAIAEYIVDNPVRKGMVSRWSDYPYSRFLGPLPM